MNELKAASAPVDTERVVRDLVDAFKSLKARAPLTWPQPGEREEERAPESGRAEPERILASQSTENSETGDHQLEAQSRQSGVIEGFCRSHGIVERFQVTPEELQALFDASLLGSLTCKEDMLFMLRQIRKARTPEQPSTTVVLEQNRTQYPRGAPSPKPASKTSSETLRNNNGEREANGSLPKDHKEQDFGAAIKNLSDQITALYDRFKSASQTEQQEKREHDASELHENRTRARAALSFSAASLVVSILTLGVLYRTLGAYRRYTTSIATQVAIISKQSEVTQKALSAIQAEAIAANLASQAAKSQADSSKTQAEAAALSARNARNILSVAEAADVNVEAIVCSPGGELSPGSTLTLRYRNSGRTRAENFDSVFFFGIPAAVPAPESVVPSTEVSAASVAAGSSIRSPTVGTVSDSLSRSLGSIPPEQTFQKIVAGQLTFGIWGSIRYVDVFGERHLKNFEYLWDRNFPNACLFTVIRTSGR